MRRRYFIKVIKKTCFVFIFAIILCGCNKASQTDLDPNSSSVSADEIGESNSVSDSNNEIKDIASQKRNAKSLYSSFIDGNEPVYFDIYLDDISKSEDNYDVLDVERGKGYNISELVDKVVDIYVYDGIEQFSLDVVKYAYLDCGCDDEPELALLFDDISVYGSLNNELFLIKCIDNKLQVCSKYYYGYRSNMELYTDGTAIYSGSSSASSDYYELMIFDADCKKQFILNNETTSGFSLYVPDCDIDLYELSERLGIDDKIYFESYSFIPYEEYNDYDKYYSGLLYTYYPLDDNYDIIEDNNDEFYSSTSPYYMFMKASGINFKKPDEVNQIVLDRAKEFGCDNLSEKKKVKFTTFYHAGYVIDDYSYENDEYAPASITVENPGWEYYSRVDYNPDNLPITLTKSYEAANNIIDSDGWFQAINQVMPEPDYKEDDDYYYYLSDYNNYEYTSVTVYSKYSGEVVAFLDMSEFASPPGLVADNAWLITEGIRDVKYYGGILYVAINHSTYASSAPQNGYIVALDPSDNYSVIWKSQPLVSNACNFQVIDNTVICGYGFTDEPDFLYLLDRYSGVQTGVFKLKSGPDYIYIVNDKLYVRTYNTNYVFDISYG